MDGAGHDPYSSTVTVVTKLNEDKISGFISDSTIHSPSVIKVRVLRRQCPVADIDFVRIKPKNPVTPSQKTLRIIFHGGITDNPQRRQLVVLWMCYNSGFTQGICNTEQLRLAANIDAAIAAAGDA
jgi:hypothetical protein